MVDLNGFDANKHQPMGSFPVAPKGDYRAMITGSKKNPVKDDPRYHHLTFTFQILDGEHQAITPSTLLNLWNKNPRAVEMANQELTSICTAIGMMTPPSSEAMHNKPMIISLDIEEYDGKLKNVFTGYAPISGGAVGVAPGGVPSQPAGGVPGQGSLPMNQPPAQAPTPAQGNAPADAPWRKKGPGTAPEPPPLTDDDVPY